MSSHVSITYRGIEPSLALSELIEQEAEKLERYSGFLMTQKVTLRYETAHGRSFHLQVELTVPGQVLVTEAASHGPNADAFGAVKEAFKSARRLLKDRAARQRAVARHAHGP
jgi:ribosome-associated translation inhibitor RaiA